jgi:hypothetical protein
MLLTVLDPIFAVLGMFKYRYLFYLYGIFLFSSLNLKKKTTTKKIEFLWKKITCTKKSMLQ